MTMPPEPPRPEATPDEPSSSPREAAPLAMSDSPLPPPPAPPSSPPPPPPAAPGGAGGARFCTACGAALGEGATFCSNCGTPVGATLDYRAATIPPGSIELAGTSYALAGFWHRFAAVFIDGIVYSIAAAPLYGLVVFQVLAVLRPGIDSDGRVDPDWDALAGLVRSGVVWIWVLSAIGIVVSLAVEAYGWSPGKAAMGIRVLRADGHRPGWVHGAARYVGKTISSLPFLLGYLWVIWDSRKQAWHDKFANTYVVKVPMGGVAEPAASGPLALSTGAKVWAGIAALYILYNAINLATFAAVIPRDGATLERFFREIEEQNRPPSGPGFRPRSFNIEGTSTRDQS